MDNVSAANDTLSGIKIGKVHESLNNVIKVKNHTWLINNEPDTDKVFN